MSGDKLKDKVFVKNEDLISRKVAGEVFLVPVKGRLADLRNLYTLNPVAEYIWNELLLGKTEGDILKGLLDSFDVDRGLAEADLKEFIDDLLRAGLIKA